MNFQKKLAHWHSFRLYKKAVMALEEGELEHAMSIGHKLKSRGYSGGWEIEARAFMEEHHYWRSRVILEDAVQRFPTVFRLWSYLGECRSNLGDYEEAIQAWNVNKERGEKSAYPDLNIAVVCGRMNQPTQGIDVLRSIGDSDQRVTILRDNTLVWLLHLGGQMDEATELIAKLRADGRIDARSIGIEALIAASQGKTTYAHACALEALDRDKRTDPALEAIRLLHGKSGPGSCPHKVQIEGVREVSLGRGKTQRLGFFTHYWVKADSPEAALQFIQPFESEALGSLAICSFERENEDVEGPDGVYRVQGGYTFFDL